MEKNPTYHFGCRVQNLHLFQNSSTIISDCHIAFSILDLRRKRRNIALISNHKPLT